MITRIIGDIHEDWYSYQLCTEPQFAPEMDNSIQLGDMFIGLIGDYRDEQIETFHRSNRNHRFIRGNHDNPATCRGMTGYIPDGTIENDIMFVGGAFSIDWFRRTPGVNWWEDEELSVEELYRMIELYERVKPRVMITHDAPINITEALFVKTGMAVLKSQAKTIPTLTGMAFQTMFEFHKPDLWLFGHWHHTVEKDVCGTHFHCVGLGDHVDINLKTGDYVDRPFF